MPDYGAKVADKAIDATARKVHRVYERAAKEIKAELKGFTKRFAAKDKEKRELLSEGKITKAEYDLWRKGQIFMQQQWKDKLDQATRIMTHANEEAADIVRSGSMNVFAENYNYSTYKMEKQIGGASSFNVYNEKTVARLVKKKPDMLPEWKVDEDKDYKWSRQKAENVITQGIIQGKGIEDITADMADALESQNENRMRTFARTAMTGAQNAGRIEQMHDAEALGIKVKKRWLATLDSRTRDTHAELDGQEVGVDEPFVVDGMEIMFPGDPSCPFPELVYNCRCTMIQVYEGIDRTSVRRDSDNELVTDMTYKEWKDRKKNGDQPARQEKQTKTEPNKEKKPRVLKVDDSELIEKDRKEHEERAEKIAKLEEERKQYIDEQMEAVREEQQAKSDYNEGLITKEEYEERSREADKKWQEAKQKKRGSV